jgi:hypothetical protein
VLPALPVLLQPVVTQLGPDLAAAVAVVAAMLQQESWVGQALGLAAELALQQQQQLLLQKVAAALAQPTQQAPPTAPAAAAAVAAAAGWGLCQALRGTLGPAAMEVTCCSAAVRVCYHRQALMPPHARILILGLRVRLQLQVTQLQEAVGMVQQERLPTTAAATALQRG